jgi:hypothetical protein
MSSMENIERYNKIFAILTLSYGDSEFNTIINTDLAEEIDKVLSDIFVTNKSQTIKDLIIKSYGDYTSSGYVVEGLLAITGFVTPSPIEP